MEHRPGHSCKATEIAGIGYERAGNCERAIRLAEVRTDTVTVVETCRDAKNSAFAPPSRLGPSAAPWDM